MDFSIVNIFVPGPPPQPTTTEVIEKISNKIDKGFEEQQEFIASEMKKQKEFMEDQFEKINENMKELRDKQEKNDEAIKQAIETIPPRVHENMKALLSKEALIEMKRDSMAMLEQVKEHYYYLLPNIYREDLDITEAMDLDQNVGVIHTTYQTARAKFTFIERCPPLVKHMFSFWGTGTQQGTNTTAKYHVYKELTLAVQTCTLLLKAYLEIEWFRDVTITQLITVMEKTPLKELNQGYLKINEERKQEKNNFIETYVIPSNRPEKGDVFCPFFMECATKWRLETCPWKEQNDKKRMMTFLSRMGSSKQKALASVDDICEGRL